MGAATSKEESGSPSDTVKNVNNEHMSKCKLERPNLIFPNEILEKIVSFLTIRDKLLAREICLDWMYYVNSAVGIHELVKIKISSDELSHLISSPLDPVFTSFYFHKVDITRQSIAFWSLYSNFITHLDFYDCSVIPRNTVDSQQADFMLGCPNLKHLSLVNCDKYFLMGGKFIQLHEILHLENLVSLNLSKNKNLTDNILFSILLKTNNLERLDLSDCVNMVFMKAVHNRFYVVGSVRPPYSDHVLSFHTVFLDFLQTTKARNMKEFNFGMRLNSTAMELLMSCDNIRWKAVNLESTELKSVDVKLFLSKFNDSLSEVDLGRCKLTSDEILCANMYQLEKLSIHDARNITTLNFLQTMPNLRTLILDGASGFSLSSSALEDVCNVTALSLNGIRPLGNPEDCRNELINYFRKLKRLESLDLGNCSQIVNDYLAQEIIQHLRKLKRLNLEDTIISDFGLTGISKQSCETEGTALQELASALNSVFSLSELACLEHLNLSKCRYLGDLTWNFAIRLPNLISLNLSSCTTLSKRGILSIIRNCRNIENLILVHCSLQILSDPEVLNSAREILHRCKSITY